MNAVLVVIVSAALGAFVFFKVRTYLRGWTDV